jgi:hypothetical protein
VKPVRPFAGGWYLQDPVGTVQQDGTWTVTPAKLASNFIPPKTGDIFAIQVILAHANTSYQGKPLNTVDRAMPFSSPLDVQGAIALSDEVPLIVG